MSVALSFFYLRDDNIVLIHNPWIHNEKKMFVEKALVGKTKPFPIHVI